MPYTKTNWQSGDIISSQKLNHAEDGIAQAQQTADAANARDTLGELTDVNISNPTEGQVVLYDATNSKWINGDAGGGVEYVNVYDVTTRKLTKTVEELLELIQDNTKKLCIIVPSSSSANGINITSGTYLFTQYLNLGNYNFIFSNAIFTASFTSEKPALTGMGPIFSHNYPTRITSLHDKDVIMLHDSYPYYWYNSQVDLNMLSDTTITSPTDGQVLTYDATNNVWINTTSSAGVSNLSDLSDVALGSTVSSGQFLRYNNTSGKWQNQTFTAMDTYTYVNNGDNSLLYSSDVLWVSFIQYGKPIAINTSTLGFIPLTKAINESNTTYTFIFGDRVYSGSRYTTPTFVKEGLGALKGINITSPTDGQVLTYDATNSVWKNATPSSSGDDAPVVLTLYDYTDTEGTYGTANTTYLYSDDYGIITYSRLLAAFGSGQQIMFQKLETGSNYYSTNMSLKESNGTAYFQVDNIVYAAVEENDGKFIKQNTRTEFYYSMEGNTLTGPRAPEVIKAVELGLDVKLYCDFSYANNTSSTSQFLKIKKLKLEFSYKCYNENEQCYEYVFQAYDHIPIEYTDTTKQMNFSIVYSDNSDYGSYYGVSF